MIAPARDVFTLIHSPGFDLEKLKGLKVSEHFSWLEVFHSRSLLDVKKASLQILMNATSAAARMEHIREYLTQKLGKVITIEVISWYRSPEANTAAGGANKSQHLLALAVDFIVPGFDDKQIQALLAAMKDSIGYCLEITNGHWTHVDLRPAHFVFENLGGGNYKVLSLAEMNLFVRTHGKAA